MKTEFKGTKEKWELDIEKKGVSINGNLIVTCWGENTDDIDERLRGESWLSMRDRTKKEREQRLEIRPKANALLISKSPEMLEMLQDIYAKYEKDGHLLNVSPSKIKQLIKEATELC